MALKQYQQLKQNQRLSPLQMQVIKLTELSTLEFEEKVKQEIEENPALEEGRDRDNDEEPFNVQSNDENSNISQEEIALGDYFKDEDIPDFYLPSSPKENYTDIPFAMGSTLNEYLIEQLGELTIDNNDKEIAKYIIGSIDTNGYLERSLQSISDDLLFQQNIDVPIDKLNETLAIVKSLEPAGIAAGSLQECLLIQLERKDPTPIIDLSIIILKDYFDEFSKKHYEKIIKALHISEEDMKSVIKEIVTLNPKPGSLWGDTVDPNTQFVTPDFIVEIVNNEVLFSLNSRNVPPLRISKDYGDLLKEYSSNKKGMSSDEKNAAMFVKQKLDAAKWFIDSVHQRQETMQNTMKAIIDRQYDFFLTEEDSSLKPMILKDIADDTGYDISTISRITNSKYVQVSMRIYPLKYFFSKSMQTESGEDVSSKEIRNILLEFIENENKKKPLSDDKLTEMLNDKGYKIARRTVSKYREMLNLPIARLRKEM